MLDTLLPKSLSKSHARKVQSLAKAMTWRVAASADTFILSYIITGRLLFAGSIASAEVFTKILVYYFHERAWAHVDWGYQEPPKTHAHPPEPQRDVEPPRILESDRDFEIPDTVFLGGRQIARANVRLNRRQ